MLFSVNVIAEEEQTPSASLQSAFFPDTIRPDVVIGYRSVDVEADGDLRLAGGLDNYLISYHVVQSHVGVVTLHNYDVPTKPLIENVTVVSENLSYDSVSDLQKEYFPEYRIVSISQ